MLPIEQFLALANLDPNIAIKVRSQDFRGDRKLRGTFYIATRLALHVNGFHEKADFIAATTADGAIAALWNHLVTDAPEDSTISVGLDDTSYKWNGYKFQKIGVTV